jgi:hypothetical protein
MTDSTTTGPAICEYGCPSPDCRWLARIVSFGLNRNYEIYPRALGPAFVELLPSSRSDSIATATG